jgi:nicotinamide mononucleotide transporter
VISGCEIAANVLNGASIVLAGRNNVHTWWTGIVGCVLFGVVFYEARLYADVTLQVFFVATSLSGWWNWLRGNRGSELPVRRTGLTTLAVLAGGGGAVTIAYGWLLHHYTNAYAPYLDSTILAFSVLGQFLLMGRRVENWWFWLVVNSIAVPLYSARGLFLTAFLYALFWINAAISLRHWRRMVVVS